MIKSSLSLALVIALVFSLGGSSVFAQTRDDSEAKGIIVEALSESHTDSANGARPNAKLRAELLKLIAETKAGKVVPPGRAQIQPAQSNNLSKGAKIAMGVGIAVAVVVVVLIIRKPRLTGPVL
jgi:hypothetical protein